ncbi:long chain fatty alcohol oxidase [Biscogniauxia mediterranea]|nr:long chain fatty alcohol oxidase [Biscogniauxia mediterranea]
MATPADQESSPPAHVAVPLPPPPDTSFFNETQWQVWFALLDAAVPSIVSDADAEGKERRGACRISADALDAHFATAKAKVATPTPLSRAEFEDYLAERVADTPAFRDSVARTLSSVSPDMRKMLGKMLSLLGTSWASVPLAGHRRPFHALTADQREAVLRSWLASRFQALRLFAKTVTTLAKKAYVQTSPVWGRLGGWTDLPTAGWPPARRPPPVGYAFKQFAPAASPVVLDTDVVVVGSGCGGGVAAKVLAEAGHRVLVVDKGHYFPPEMLPMPSLVAEAHLFESGGAIPTDDGTLNIVAGSTWGGGGTVNWGVSLQAPDYVLQEWAQRDGLPFFATPAFRDSCARVCDFMGVSAAGVRHNHRGRALLEGAARLGLDARPTPHNSGRDGAAAHDCGHCHFGCGSGAKQGPAVSWLPAAARAGAEFIEGFRAERVLFDDDDDDGEKATKGRKGKKRRRATGVVGTWVSRDKDGGVGGGPEERITREVVVRAKRVVVACGTLWTPLLLMKSGLKNPHIGKNLHLHPVNIVSGFWKEEVRPWEGCAITSVCTSLENLDNNGHGVNLEPMSMVPPLIYSNLPWRSALDFKLTALRYRHMQMFFSMARDRDTGHVYPDRATGKPRVAYAPSAFDRAHALEGVVALARICYAAGAEEIRPFLAGVEPFSVVRRPPEGGGDDETGDKDEDFQAWLRRVRAAGNSATAAWGSAHQMGSCRMGRSEKTGVVDARGAVWEVDGLYLADASVFPSASGVNPMVTVMAIADWVARGMVEELKEEGVKSNL